MALHWLCAAHGDINNDDARNVSDINCYTTATLANAQGLTNNPSCQAFDDADADLNVMVQLMTDVQRAILTFSLAHRRCEIEGLPALQDPDSDYLHNGCDEDDDNDSLRTLVSWHSA